MDAKDKEYYEKYRKYYNKYQKVRKIKLKLNPICERCIKNKIVKQANEVHHKIPISTGITADDKYNLATSIDNLESLCFDCHNIEHGKYSIPELFW